MLRFSAWLTWVTGIIVAGAVAAINWNEFGTARYPARLWLLYFPAIFILMGGAATLKGAPRGPFTLLVAWGFLAGGVWMALILPGFILDSLQEEARRSLYLVLQEKFVLLLFLALTIFGVAISGLATASLGLELARPRSPRRE